MAADMHTYACMHVYVYIYHSTVSIRRSFLIAVLQRDPSSKVGHLAPDSPTNQTAVRVINDCCHVLTAMITEYDQHDLSSKSTPASPKNYNKCSALSYSFK